VPHPRRWPPQGGPERRAAGGVHGALRRLPAARRPDRRPRLRLPGSSCAFATGAATAASAAAAAQGRRTARGPAGPWGGRGGAARRPLVLLGRAVGGAAAGCGCRIGCCRSRNGQGWGREWRWVPVRGGGSAGNRCEASRPAVPADVHRDGRRHYGAQQCSGPTCCQPPTPGVGGPWAENGSSAACGIAAGPCLRPKPAPAQCRCFHPAVDAPALHGW
jgi:hypothetical protein